MALVLARPSRQAKKKAASAETPSALQMPGMPVATGWRLAHADPSAGSQNLCIFVAGYDRRIPGTPFGRGCQRRTARLSARSGMLTIRFNATCPSITQSPTLENVKTNVQFGR
jgi:hypothetical protein